MDELAVAQCSSFVKNHEWIPAIYFVVMFECCSIFILMHLFGHLLIIADRCHICFDCHFQTVHPIPVIFISISTEITPFPVALLVFQVEARFNHSFPKSCICITYLIPHIISCSCVGCLLCCVLLFRCLLLRIGSGNVAFVRTRSSTSVCLLHGLVLLPCGISGKMITPSKSLLSLLA